MSLYINTNSEALIAQNNLNSTESKLGTAMTDLSSGLRINTAADDAAGYSISEDLSAQVSGLSQATSNAQNGVSMVQTADGALNSVEEMLQRIRELAVEYQGGTLDAADQGAIVSEVNQLASQIDQIGTEEQFNGISLFNGSTVTFQVGANDQDKISVTLTSLASLGVDAIGSALTSSTILSTINGMIDSVSAQASQLGAVQNRLSYTLDNISTYSENLTSAQSTIQDVDMASEMTEFTKDQILEQAGVSMLSQAEQNPQQILKLIQNA